MSWRAILTLLLLAAAALCAMSLWHHRATEEQAAVDTGRSAYVLRDFELVSLDDTGKESFTLRAPQLQETPGKKTTDIVTPVFLLPDSDGAYWDVRAKTGWISAAHDEVRLRGKVVASNEDKGVQPAVMRTEQLNVFPQKHTATSKVLVTLTQPGSTMQGVGMRADLKGKRIQLLSQVRGTYDSKH